MAGGVSKGFSISDYTTQRDSLRNITLADVTIQNCSSHLISVQGEFHAQDLMLHNLHLINSGQQLIKVNPESLSDPRPSAHAARSRIPRERPSARPSSHRKR